MPHSKLAQTLSLTFILASASLFEASASGAENDRGNTKPERAPWKGAGLQRV